MPFLTRAATIALVAALTLACSANGSSQLPSTSEASGGDVAPALTDPHIAAIVVAANRIDIENAEQALAKSSNPEIRKFAQTMMSDHSGVNKLAGDLAAKLSLTPEPNETSASLVRSAEDTRAELAKKNGAEFDRAYIANEIAYHKTVLGALDSALIPSASNAELKGLLESARPAFVAHLEYAEQVSKKVAK